MSDDGELMGSLEDDFDHSQATVIFILGLLSVVMCQICGPIALIMGNKYRAACAEVGVEPDGMATAGWILGIVGTVLLCITLAILLVYFGFLCLYIVGIFFFVFLAGVGAAL